MRAAFLAFGLILLGVVPGFIAGRISVVVIDVSKEHRPGREKPDDSALVEKLTDDPFLVLDGWNESYVSVRRTAALQSITSAVVSNKNINQVRASFHPSGTIASVGLRYNRGYLRSWTFRENGTLASETLYDKPGGMRGTQTFYREDGTIEKTTGFQIHHGS